VYFDRSQAYEQSGDLRKALEDLDHVIRYYPNEYSCYYSRANIRHRLGDREGCDKDLQTTAALLSNLSKYRKLNQTEQNILSSIQGQLN
jgi:tetratricopeptide (TPR) repeat protein